MTARKSVSEQKSLEEFLSDASTSIKDSMETLDATLSKLVDTSSAKVNKLGVEDKASETGMGESYEAAGPINHNAHFRNLKNEEHVTLLMQLRQQLASYQAMFLNVIQRIQQNDILFQENIRHRDQLFNAYMTHYTTALSDERVQKSGIRTPEIQGGSAIKPTT